MTEFDDHVDDRARPKSRSQKKRDAQAVGRLGQRLLGLKAHELESLPLDEALRAEILDGQRLTKNARSRQLRLIAKMLRERETDDIEAALRGADAVSGAQVAAEQASERWRARLLEEGDAALTDLLREHPTADAGLLRALMRQSAKLPEGARRVRVRRELLRAIRALYARPAAPPQEQP